MAWDDIRGHDGPKAHVQSAHRRGRLGHAYLFVGPVGVGKQRFAIELAKAMLCEDPPEPLTACDRCPACAQVKVGTHPDLIVTRKPDDKLELPVDLIRELCANLSLRPVRGRHRVAILEDADDFNEEGANAFLKTLEEPSPGSLLILLASSTQRQLPTILSRCQVLRFQPLSSADLRLVLMDGGTTDPTTLDRLVRLSGGSASVARSLADAAVWQYRQGLLAGLAAAKPDAVGLAASYVAFVEAAGREGSVQRERASVVLRLLMDLLQAVLRLALGSEVIGFDASEVSQLRRIADRIGPDRAAELLDFCTDADRNIERRLQLVLMIEQLADRLCR